MGQGNRVTAVLAVAALATVAGVAIGAAPAPTAGCNADGELQYLCGPANAEDLVRLGETRWIIASADGRTLYVAAFGTSEIFRFERNGNGVSKQVVKVEIGADNLRWTPDGKILAAGNNTCGTPPCPPGWKVIEIDPATLAARTVAASGRTTGMAGATVGIRVGNEIWVGTYQCDRIGYLPYKPQ